MLDPGIFRAYDIRGIYGHNLNADVAYRIGRAFVSFVGCRRVVVGRDMRPHSKPLFDALSRGLTDQGADVVDLGLCSTPMSYFANGLLGADGGIMITASHNTAEWNGLKLSRASAVPISGDTGIDDIRDIVMSDRFARRGARRGTVTSHDIAPEYAAMVRSHAEPVGERGGPLRVAADFANAMGVVEARALEGILDIDPLYDELDGSFPNHEANPLKAEAMADLQAMVRGGGHDLGIAFDGDADRVGFVDERGGIVPNDMTAALIGSAILAKNPGGRVLYDLRSSWAVRESIEEAGGKAGISRVGHAFIKRQMRDEDAVFASELSGHYYFRENLYCESSALAAVLVANMVRREGKPLSELIAPFRRYHASGEINSTVADLDAVFERLLRAFPDGRQHTLDGLSVEYDDWWFNVRPSNTEPLVRLNLEARTRREMERRRDEVLGIIRG
ncbi:MAG: phosphomannomutase/phosphoglucomutase [Thermoplasmata archaeon]|nr:phosphomannomutase/phosphoglucomutase [Thermoplasmata archaeon]